MTVTRATAANDVLTTTPPRLTDLLVSLADPKSDFAAENMVRPGAGLAVLAHRRLRDRGIPVLGWDFSG